jgi:hypothetical protein
MPRNLAPVFNAIKKANNAAAAKKAANNAAAKKAANNAAAKAKKRHAKLKAEIISLKNMMARRGNSTSSRELRELFTEQRAFMRQMRERENRAHRYSSIRGTPTNYYNRNFHRLYRVPPSHQGLSRYYYYQQQGVPHYLQQLPGRVWKLNQSGRALPPVPFYPSRRRVGRVRR